MIRSSHASLKGVLGGNFCDNPSTIQKLIVELEETYIDTIVPLICRFPFPLPRIHLHNNEEVVF